MATEISSKPEGVCQVYRIPQRPFIQTVDLAHPEITGGTGGRGAGSHVMHGVMLGGYFRIQLRRAARSAPAETQYVLR